MLLVFLPATKEIRIENHGAMLDLWIGGFKISINSAAALKIANILLLPDESVIRFDGLSIQKKIITDSFEDTSEMMVTLKLGEVSSTINAEKLANHLKALLL